MPRNRHNKSARSSFPVSEPSAMQVAPIRPVREKPAFDSQELQELLDEEKIEEALEMMDLAPKWVQRDPEFRLIRATTLLEYGDFEQGGQLLMDLERSNPKFTPVYAPLAMWYMMHMWPALALRAARKVLSDREVPPEIKQEIQSLISVNTAIITDLANELGIPYEKAEQASWYNEKNQVAQLYDDIAEAEKMAREATKIAPHWSAAINNYAYAIYFRGRCREAVAEIEKNLASHPDNIPGLHHMVMFLTGLGQAEQAKPYAQRLFEISKNMKISAEGEDFDKIILALAFAEADELLWEIAQRFLKKPADTLFSMSWHNLGVAAARLGHFKEAKKYIAYCVEESDSERLLSLQEDIHDAIKSKQNRLLWLPRYAGMEQFIPLPQLKEWGEIYDKVEEFKPTPSQQRKLDAIISRYPYLLTGFKTMLWDETMSDFGSGALSVLNKPELDAEILRFAFSDCGDNHARMQAAMKLIDLGRYSPPDFVKFWNSDKDEWQEVKLFSQQVTEDVEFEIKPSTAALIEKSRRAKSPQETIAILRQAVKEDPTCALALHNLGVILSQEGNTEEGEQMIRRSVEVDPDYTFGHASLAMMEVNRENKAAALEHLMKIQAAKKITPQTAAISNIAYMLIAIQDDDIETARRHYDAAKEFGPENALVKKYEETMEQAAMFSERFGFLREWQKESANRAHRKLLTAPIKADMGLDACLSMFTKDMLTAMCQFWKTQSIGKKDELVRRLSNRIIDADIFFEILSALEENEKSALKWLLDGGGMRLWKEFTAQFGDDADESVYWIHHQPETIAGKLRLAGLLFTGTLDGKEMAFVPVELRSLVAELVKRG